MIINVKVIPKSSQNKVLGFEGEVLKVRCTAVPKKGKANDSVIKLLSKHFKVPKSSITLIKGKTSSLKIFEILDPPRV